MNVAAQSVEIFLHPGEYAFAEAGMRIRTVLGSCVAITLWHPRLRIGGMCHYLLPARSGGAAAGLDGRYAEEAVELLMQEAARRGTRAGEYQVKLFGGGNMLAADVGVAPLHVGLRNVEAGRRLLYERGMASVVEHVGSKGHRNIVFDIGSGNVWMRHSEAELHSCNQPRHEHPCQR